MRNKTSLQGTPTQVIQEILNDTLQHVLPRWTPSTVLIRYLYCRLHALNCSTYKVSCSFRGRSVKQRLWGFSASISLVQQVQK